MLDFKELKKRASKLKGLQTTKTDAQEALDNATSALAEAMPEILNLVDDCVKALDAKQEIISVEAAKLATKREKARIYYHERQKRIAGEAKPEIIKSTLTVGALIIRKIKDGLDNDAILVIVKSRFPKAKTTVGSIGWYRSRMKNGKPVSKAKRISREEAAAGVKKAVEEFEAKNPDNGKLVAA